MKYKEFCKAKCLMDFSISAFCHCAHSITRPLTKVTWGSQKEKLETQTEPEKQITVSHPLLENFRKNTMLRNMLDIYISISAYDQWGSTKTSFHMTNSVWHSYFVCKILNIPQPLEQGTTNVLIFSFEG